MNMQNYAEVAVRGKTIRVPTIVIDGRTVIVTGGLIKTAKILDAEFVEGNLVNDPTTFISKLHEDGLGVDVFTFPQKVYDETPKYPYPFDWDNAAVVSTVSFDDWWTKLPQESRKNARRAAKRGIIVQTAKFDESLIKGIKGVYDESPVRQGKRFWHYGKDLETVKKENNSYHERSEFIGAYLNGELIGFMKFVCVDQAAIVMQILSRTSHFDKRPMNALIAKAVEVCQERGLSYLVYGKYTYGNKDKSQLSEFKRRNGFVRMEFPRYFIPLTLSGKIFTWLKLHRGLLGLLPPELIELLRRIRAALLCLTHKK